MVDKKYKESGGKGYIINPKGSPEEGAINDKNYTNAIGDLNAAAAVIEEFYPDWKSKWLKDGKLKRGVMPKLRGLIEKVENIPELREKHDDTAMLIETALAKANSDVPEALEGLKIMAREWQKLSNLGKYGQRQAYKRNVILDQTEKNRPPKPRPPLPQPPVPPPDRGEGVVLSVHVEPDNAGRTSPRDGEVHRYEKNSMVTVQQRPNKSYTFDHWVLDGTLIPAAAAPARIAADGQSVLDVLMDRNHTVFAVFVQEPLPPPAAPPPPPPPEQIHITIRSVPITNVSFSVDGHQKRTDDSVIVLPGQHLINIAPRVNQGGRTWIFQHWNDGINNPNRILKDYKSTILKS